MTDLPQVNWTSGTAAPLPLPPCDQVTDGSVWDGPLVDRLGRVHTDLRISVTDRCNIRCFYCMPAEHVTFLDRQQLLSYEELERFVHIAARLGIKTLRLTGGEPLVRRELWKLVERLVRVPGITDIALTTNGLLLAEQAQELRAAGLRRLNVSLDALDAETFALITRRSGHERVLAGITAAQAAGFTRLRVNTVAIRGVNEDQFVPLARFARDHDLELRFIEYMPLDADGRWNDAQVVPGSEILTRLTNEIGPLEPLPVTNPSQPATDYRFTDGRGSIGLINPVTQPFCGNCNRLRITAEGQLRNCLFSTTEWDARALLRGTSTDEAMAALIRDCIWHKRPGHGIGTAEFIRPERAMFQIGG